MIIEIFYAILIFYIAIVLGLKVFRMFKLELPFNEELIFSIAFGFAILGFLILALGLLGFLYKLVFIILFLFLFIITITEAKLLVSKFKKVRLKINWMIILAIIFVILGFIGALSPPIGWDTQIYHLPAQEQYLSQNKITYIQLIHSDLPALGDMFILLGLLIKSDILAKLIFYSVFLVLIFAVYVFSKKYFGEKIASLAVLIFVSLPQIIYYSSTLHTDIFLTLFTFLAILSFFYWSKKKENKWLFVSAAFLGLAFSTKITAIITLIVFFILFLLLFFIRKDKKEILKKGLIFFIIVLIITLPWFIKAFAFTGNPVYPIAYNVFGGPQNLSHATEYTNAQLADSGYGRGFFSFILSPFYITANGYKFHSSFALTPLFLVFIPLLLFLRKNNLIKYFLLFSFIYFVVWFFIHPFLLKLIPLLPFLSIIIAFTIIKGFEKKIIFKFIWIFIIFSFIFSLLMSGLIYQNQIKVALGLETRENYLSRSLGIFNTFNYANKNLNSSYKVLLIGEARNYYLEIPFQEGDPVRQGIIDYRTIDEKGLENWLKEEGISYIIINRNYFVNISDNKLNLYGYTEYSKELVENFIQKNTEEVYDKNEVFLYEIK